jgi:hypothetical protein
MLGLEGGNGKDDKVVMFLSIVVGAAEFILFARIVRVMEDCNASNVLSTVWVTDTNVHVRIKI